MPPRPNPDLGGGERVRRRDAHRGSPAPGGAAADAKQYDEALKRWTRRSGAFEPLAADRRGDILMAAGQARRGPHAAYQAAFKGLGEKTEYRRLVEAKLIALGDGACRARGVASAASGGQAGQ
jgi:hypothetical protein